MRQQRRKGSWHPLLAKLMQFSVRHPKLARKLVQDHPEVLELRTRTGETALHYLAIENYAEAVQLLIDLGADVNVKNEFGASALEEAIQVRARESVEVLRRAGAVPPPTEAIPGEDETIEAFLERIRERGDERRVSLFPPLTKEKIRGVADAFHSTFGVPLPDEYLRLLSISSGLFVPLAFIAAAEMLIEHNQQLWLEEYVTDAKGCLERIVCRRPTYIWLGNAGIDDAELVYDVAGEEYQEVALDDRRRDYRGPTLIGLLHHLVDRAGGAG